ncbi:hypothetical protein ABK040_015209 [Willaertia magna]
MSENKVESESTSTFYFFHKGDTFKLIIQNNNTTLSSTNTLQQQQVAHHQVQLFSTSSTIFFNKNHDNKEDNKKVSWIENRTYLDIENVEPVDRQLIKQPELLFEISNFLNPLTEIFPILRLVCKQWNEWILKHDLFITKYKSELNILNNTVYKNLNILPFYYLKRKHFELKYNLTDNENNDDNVSENDKKLLYFLNEQDQLNLVTIWKQVVIKKKEQGEYDDNSNWKYPVYERSEKTKEMRQLLINHLFVLNYDAEDNYYGKDQVKKTEISTILFNINGNGNYLITNLDYTYNLPKYGEGYTSCYITITFVDMENSLKHLETDIDNNSDNESSDFDESSDEEENKKRKSINKKDKKNTKKKRSQKEEENNDCQQMDEHLSNNNTRLTIEVSRYYNDYFRPKINVDKVMLKKAMKFVGLTSDYVDNNICVMDFHMFISTHVAFYLELFERYYLNDYGDVYGLYHY